MKKETKAAIAKFGVKLALKYTGAELLGDAAGIVADVGETVLPETTKTFLEAFSDTTADFFADKAGDLTSQYLTKGEKYVNFHLARGICKVWEDALTQSLPKNRAANSKYILIPQDSFQDFSNELEFFIEKFKQAQIQGNEALLLELFYDQDKSETYFYTTFFEGVQDEKSAEEAYWATLEKTLIVWATREGKFRYDWKNGFPEEFKRELKKFFFGNLRYGLKEIFDKNDPFRNAFNFSVELITFDLIKKLPEKIREDIENAQSENRFYYSQLQERFSDVEMRMDILTQAIQKAFEASLSPELIEKIEETHFISKKLYKIFKLYYFSEVDYSSKTLKQAVLNYLLKIADKTTELNKIYPEEFKSKEKKSIFFNNITQRVQVVKKEQFDIYKAKLDEKARIDGTFREEIEKKIYDQRSFEAEMFQRETQERIEIYEWNEKTRKDFKRNVILGDPGLGKSSLLNFEAHKLSTEAIQILQNAKDTPEETVKILKSIIIPLNLRIADIAGEAKKDKELVLTIAELASFDEAVNDERKSLTLFLKETIYKQQNAVLLFDALDEVPEETEKGLTRKEIADKIGDFAKEYQENSILLTSRKVNYEIVNLHNAKQTSLSDENLEILPFDETQIKNYVSGWFGKDSKTTVIFLNLLENQSQTAGLSQNPLMLSLMCRVFYEKQRGNKVEEAEKNFPNSRCEIYEECLQGLLKDWKDGKSKKTITTATLQSQVRKLERTAFNLFFKGYEQFSETDFQTAFCGIENINLISDEADENSRKFLEECKTDGIITETTSGKNPQYRFIHLTFQEYLTASYLAKQPDWKDFIFEKYRKGLQNKILFNADWQHTLQLLGGKLSADDAEDYIETLLQLNGENGEGDLLFRPYLLAHFVAKEASGILAEDYKIELIGNLFDKYYNPPDFQYDEVFLLSLKNWGSKITNQLLPYLDNLNTINKKQSIIFLISRNQDLEIINLLSVIGTDKKKVIRKFLQLFIDNVDDKDFLNSLADALRNIKDIPVEFVEDILQLFNIEKVFKNTRIALMDTLANIKEIPLDYFNRIFQIFIIEKNNQNVRYMRGTALNNFKAIPLEYIEQIIQSINTEKDKSIRESMAWGLSEIENIPAQFFEAIFQLIISANYNQRYSFYLGQSLSNVKDIPIEFIQRIFQTIIDKKVSLNVSESMAWALSHINNIPVIFFEPILKIIVEGKINNSIRDLLASALINIENIPLDLFEPIPKIIIEKETTTYFRSKLAMTAGNIKNIPNEFIDSIIQQISAERHNRFICESMALILSYIESIPTEFFHSIFQIIVSEKNNEYVRDRLIEALENIKNIPSSFFEAVLLLITSEKRNEFIPPSLSKLLVKWEVTIKPDKKSFPVIEKSLIVFKNNLLNSRYVLENNTEIYLDAISLIAEKFMIAVPLEGEINLAKYELK